MKPFVTVVSGLPRSGTSLMMQMLVAGGLPPLKDELRAADDDNPKGYYEFEPVKKTKEDPSWVDAAAGKVVKMVHLLLYDLPSPQEYKVVLMRRDLQEVLASQKVMLERRGSSGANLSPEQLTAAYRDQLQKVESWLQAAANFRFLSVNYNELMEDPSPTIDELDRFFDGGLDTAAMNLVIDPSLYRQRG